MLHSYRNQSIHLHSKSTDWFYMRATLALNGLMLLSWMFILSCTTIYCKEFYFFECLCFSEYDIRMLLCFLVEKAAIHLSTNATRRGMGGIIQNACSCVKGDRVWNSCVRRYLHDLFSCFWFELVTCGFELVTCGFELVTYGFELVIRGFELVIRGFELVTCGFELVDLNFWIQLVLLSFQLVTSNS